MADPLLYNALDAYLYSDQQLAAATSQAATQEAIRAANVPLLQCCICCACLCQAQLTACQTGGGPGGAQEIIDQYSTCWPCYACIPDMNGCSGWTTQCIFWFCTSGSPGQCSCNGVMCCQWTAPANTNCVQFTIYGAGGGSWGSNCCGGSFYGGTGASAQVTVPTCSGWTYTLCAGCAQCCFLSDTASIGTYFGLSPGQRTCVCGCCLQMLAVGGKSNSNSMHWDLGFTFGSRGPDFCYGNNRCAGTGVCWCNAGYYCMTGCATCGWIPHSRTKGVNAQIQYVHPTATTPNHSPKMGQSEGVTVPGHWNSYCWDTNFYGKKCAPRLPHWYGSCSHTEFEFTSGNCCGGNCCGNQTGYLTWPGMGGMAVQVKSGTCRCGDSGRGGAVRVVYHTCS